MFTKLNSHEDSVRLCFDGRSNAHDRLKHAASPCSMCQEQADKVWKLHFYSSQKQTGVMLYSTIFFQRKSDKLYAIETAHKISRISILPVLESTTYVMPCTSLYRCPGSPGPAQRQSLNDGCEPDLHSHRHSVVVAELAKAGCEGCG